jgi:hypothetical protein
MERSRERGVALESTKCASSHDHFFVMASGVLCIVSITPFFSFTTHLTDDDNDSPLCGSTGRSRDRLRWRE